MKAFAIVLALVFVPMAFVAASEAEVQDGRDLLHATMLQIFNKADVDKFFSDPRLSLDETVLRKGITGAGFDYMSEDFGLITAKTLSDGMKYRSENWRHFKKAYQTYGTESYYILGILRLETYFGQYQAKRPVPNTLYSIYILDPARRKFALRELTYFLVETQASGKDPFTVKGSVAGAMGIPQFIPTSFYSFAVDGNGDGKKDLFTNADAIASVGNYLKDNGWGSGEEAKRSAIYAYNHDQGYVNAVMAYAKAIEAEVDKMIAK